MEAITNSDDWFEKDKKALDQEKAEQIQNIDAVIQEQFPECFEYREVLGAEGNVIGYQRVIAD